MINTIISIGYMGIKNCYLNTPIEEAKSRHFEVSHAGTEYCGPSECECPIDVIEFVDEFGAYEIWE